MSLAFDQYKEDECVVTKKSVEIDHDEMAKGYQSMAEINLNEAEAGESTLLDGMDFYGEF